MGLKALVEWGSLFCSISKERGETEGEASLAHLVRSRPRPNGLPLGQLWGATRPPPQARNPDSPQSPMLLLEAASTRLRLSLLSLLWPENRSLKLRAKFLVGEGVRPRYRFSRTVERVYWETS